MEATPVSLAENPRQHIDFKVQLGGELNADQVRRPCAFPACDEPTAVAVTALLRGEGRRVAGKCRADAAPRRRLVDVQSLLGAAGIAPAERSAAALVVDADHGVRRFRRVGAGAAGHLRQHLVEVPLEELALTVQPLLTAVHIFGKDKSNSTCHCWLELYMVALWAALTGYVLLRCYVATHSCYIPHCQIVTTIQGCPIKW